MALSSYKLNYTKDWHSAEDFPTYQSSEAQVRDDLQLLFNEMKAAFNAFLDGVKAADIPFEETAEIDSSTVQAALVNIQAQIAGVSAGAIPDNSIETSKYKNGSVTVAKLGSDVTPAGIGAAAASHTHDDRYYTETEMNTELAKVQPRTSMLTTMENDIVDTDLVPMYDISEAVNRKMTFAMLKAFLKTYFDTVYGTLLAAHASRHAANGDDPVTISAGNMATEAVETAAIKDLNVTRGKLAANAVSDIYTATITTSWLSKYTYAASVSGVEADETLELEATGYIVRGVASAADTVDITLLGTKPSAALSVKVISSIEHSGWTSEGGGKYSKTISVATTDWVGNAEPYLQELSVPGLLASDTPLVDFVPSDTYSTAQNEIDAWAEVYKMVAENDKLIVYATSNPNVALNIKLLCVRK